MISLCIFGKMTRKCTKKYHVLQKLKRCENEGNPSLDAQMLIDQMSIKLALPFGTFIFIYAFLRALFLNIEAKG